MSIWHIFPISNTMLHNSVNINDHTIKKYTLNSKLLNMNSLEPLTDSNKQATI